MELLAETAGYATEKSQAGVEVNSNSIFAAGTAGVCPATAASSANSNRDFRSSQSALLWAGQTLDYAAKVKAPAVETAGAAS
jgi:hypothetical protein